MHAYTLTTNTLVVLRFYPIADCMPTFRTRQYFFDFLLLSFSFSFFFFLLLVGSRFVVPVVFKVEALENAVKLRKKLRRHSALVAVQDMETAMADPFYHDKEVEKYVHTTTSTVYGRCATLHHVEPLCYSTSR